MKNNKTEHLPLHHFTNQSFLRKVESDNDVQEYAFVISNSNPDRHGTVIPLDRWKLDNYRANNVVFYNHETSSWTKSDPDYLIGHSRVEVEGENLIGYLTFETEDINELAEKIRKKVDFGSMKATSVGFNPISAGHWGDERDGEDPDLYYFGDVDLLEWSIVNIPSNASATLISKSMNSFLEATRSKSKVNEDLLFAQNAVMKNRNRKRKLIF